MDLSSSTISLANVPVPLALAGHDLTLDRLRPEKAPEAYQLVCMEARQGQDMGQDEFASEHHLQTHIMKEDNFGVFDRQTGELISIIMLAPSAYCRSADPLLVDGIIICDTNIKSSIIQSLIQMAKTLAMALNYEIKNRLKGEEVAKIAFMVPRPRLTFLPKMFKTPTGKEVIVRYMRDDENPYVYNMYKKASDKGNGYATDEFDTIETFCYYVIDHGHAFIIQDPFTSNILAAFTLVPIEFCRSVDPQNCGGYMVVDSASQGMQLGTLASALFTTLGRELGYTGCYSDTFVTNLPMIRVNRKNGMVITGFIPKAANGQNGRLEDVVLLYKSYEDKSRFIAKL